MPLWKNGRRESIDFMKDLSISAFPAGMVEGFLYTKITAWTQEVTLDTNAKTSVYYTLDGSSPTSLSKEYTKPIILGGCKLDSESCMEIVRAAVYNELGRITKDFVYIFDRPEGLITTKEGGIYAEDSTILLASSKGCEIYYTVDGTCPLDISGNPTSRAILYNGPIDMDNFTLNAVAVNTKRKTYSKLLTETYSIQKERLQLAISHTDGEYFEPIAVRLTCNDSDAMIKYTTNGDDPLSYMAQVYDGAIILGNSPGDVILSAVAITEDEMSKVISVKFKFKG